MGGMDISREDLLLASQLLNDLNPELATRLKAGAGSDQELWVCSWGVGGRGGSVEGGFVVDQVGFELMTWCKENRIPHNLGEVLGKHSQVVFNMMNLHIAPISDDERVQLGEGAVDGWEHLEGDHFISGFIEQKMEDLYQPDELREACNAAKTSAQQAAFLQKHYLEHMPKWLESYR